MSDFTELYPLRGEKTAIAISGGADSLYSMLRLQAAGADIFALHAIFLPEQLRPALYSDMLSRLDKICCTLGVKLYIIDLSVEFANLVIQPFIKSYQEGKTPNPCAWCNASLKFGLLLEIAKRYGASRLVTGHYARLLSSPGGIALYAGADGSKDQSYFLALTPLSALEHACFPLGQLHKSDILQYLQEHSIIIPQQKESQEICFISDNNYRIFLESYGGLAERTGEIILQDGRVLGAHNGLWNYTEGQRHGLGIAWSEPLFVLGKDIEANRLIVGPRIAMSANEYSCGQLNFLQGFESWPEQVWVKTRYRQKLQPATVEISGHIAEPRLQITFFEAETSALSAPGQVAVVYNKTTEGFQVLAGGIILADGE